VRDVTIEPVESMNELCGKLDPAMHFWEVPWSYSRLGHPDKAA